MFPAAGSVDADLTFSGTVVTGTVTLTSSPFSGGNVAGTINCDQISFGFIAGVATFDGTLSADGQSASGTYSAPSLSDNGTWSLQSTTPPPPPTIRLAASAFASRVGTPVIVTATVHDGFGNPLPNVAVIFSLAAGPDYEAGVSFVPQAGQPNTTDASGKTAISLPGYSDGVDVVNAGAITTPSAQADPITVTFVQQPGDLHHGPAKSLSVPAGGRIQTATTLATFVDPLDGSTPGPASNYTARIDWGDGNFFSTTARVLGTFEPTTYRVVPSAAHVFCRAGTYHYRVTILDSVDKESVLVSGTVSVPQKQLSALHCAFGELFFARGTTVDALNHKDAPYFARACSGTMVNSGSQLMVITAAHCLDGIYDSDGSTSGVIGAFIPSLQHPLGNDQPFGVWIASSIFVDFNYTLGQTDRSRFDAAYDFAYVKLDPNSCFVATNLGATGQCPRPGVNVGQAVGGLAIDWNPTRGQGYAIEDPGDVPAQCTPDFSNNDSLGDGPDLMVEECGMSDNGDIPVSGSPWLDTNNGIVAVSSKSGLFQFLPNLVHRNALWGTYLSAQAQADFSQAEAGFIH